MAVIALLGLRGVGKSTVGRLLARELGARFVDLDQALAAGAAEPGESAGAFLARVGEPAFRAAEERALAAVLGEAAADELLVLACGGGVVESPGARDLLAAGPTCVWLRAPAAVRGARLAADAAGGIERPDLGDDDEGIAARRAPHFEALCRIRVEADDGDPPAVAARVLGELRRAVPALRGR